MDVSEENSERWKFNADGTYTLYWYSDEGWKPDFSDRYVISDNKIELYNNGDVYDSYTISSLKGDVLVLECTFDEGPEYKQRISCMRIR